jgi:curved DNA-binding protein CbpA
VTHYDTLGVGKEATQEEIKAGYRRSAAKAHPDKGGSDEAMSQVNKAYQVLSNAQSREHYDATGQDEPAAVDGASEMLIELFDQAISACDGNVVKFVLGRLKDAADELQTKRNEYERQIAKLTKKVGRVKVKGDAPNYFEILLAKKIEDQKSRLSVIHRTADNVKQARKLMDSYESGYVEPAEMDPAYDAMQRYQTAFAKFNTGGRFY